MSDQGHALHPWEQRWGTGRATPELTPPGQPPKINSIFDFSAEALQEIKFWLEQHPPALPISQMLGYHNEFNYCALGIGTPPAAYTDTAAHKIPWDSETSDTQGWHDPASNTKVTPNVSGFYQVVCSVSLTDGFDTRDVIQLRLLVNNGTEICKVKSGGGPSCWTGIAVGAFTANGSSDYVEAELTHVVQGNTNNMTLTTGCRMTVSKIGG